MNDSPAPPWEIRRLGDIASKIQDGTHFSPVSSAGPFRYLTSRNVRFGYIDLTDSGWVSESEHRAIYRRCDPQQGDLLLTKDGANTGNAAINTLSEQFSLLSSVAMLRFNAAEYAPGFYLQYLLSPRGQSRLKAQMSGNAITRLTLAKIKNFAVPVPPPHEQWRIAEVLDSADHAIRSTGQLVTKLEDANQGLFRDLLTRGIGESGSIRSPAALVDTPLGRRPSSWITLKIEDLLEGRPKNGYSPKEVDQWTGTMMLGLGCLTRSGFRPVQLKNAPTQDAGLKRALLNDGDLLISRANTRELIGLVGRFEGLGIPCTYPDLMMRLRPNDRVLPEYLEIALRAPAMRQCIQAAASGTSGSMVKISAGVLRNLLIAIPEMAEQRRIFRVWDGAKARIGAEERRLAKLRLVKEGLMDDLLTGRMRVGALA